MEKTINLVIVSYLNTLPFIKGLSSSNDHPFNIIFAKPADCASLFLQNKCDIVLMPVGALPHAENYNIVTNYCIGCDGEVRTVCILSNNPINEITEIFLDEDSRTSVLLCKILCKELFKRKIKYTNGIPENSIKIKSNEAILAIGDKVFDLENKFSYKYDLGASWKNLTGLPFAFAIFISRNDLQDGITSTLNSLLAEGVNNINSLDLSAYKSIPNIDKYFSENISYIFDKSKWIAMKQFIEYVNLLED